MHLPFTPRTRPGVAVQQVAFTSTYLQRTVQLEVVLPPGFEAARARPYPVLYLHDGQDLRRLRLPSTLNLLYRRQAVQPFVLVAVPAGVRVQEYGVAAEADYLKRGSRAGEYTDFLLHELMPYVRAHYPVSTDPRAVVVAGFSLSGLAAFDFVWHHPAVALRAGVFSGSFWWRRRALDQGYTDADRIMHGLVRGGQPAPGQQFWLQTGTRDETNDRNYNGIIDSIEDTYDLITELEQHGLQAGRDIRYVEVVGGRHNQRTWGHILPDFLQWAFGPTAAIQDLTGEQSRWHSRQRLAHQRRQYQREQIARRQQAASFSTDSLRMTAAISRPQPGQYPAYFDEAYLPRVPAGADPLAQLAQQLAEVEALIGPLTDEQALTNYDPGKWSIKEVLLHLLDTERIFAYRALRIARGDQQPLPGFDQEAYGPEAGANNRPLTDILAEYAAVRAATLALFRSFTSAQLDRMGTASNCPVSVRALVFVTAGHEAHHLRILRERYLPLLA